MFLGFDELPPNMSDSIAKSGMCDEMSREEIAELIAGSEEFNLYSTYKNPKEAGTQDRMATAGYGTRIRRGKNK